MAGAVCDPRSGLPSRLLVAVLLVVLMYPAAVLFGGSLAPSNLRPVVSPQSAGDPVSPTWPSFELSSPRSKFADLGAATWQFEPSYRRLAEDVYGSGLSSWDPRVAGGIPRPAVLVDAQLSPLSWLAALGGGGPTPFTFAVLLLLVLGTTALIHVLEEHVGASRSAAVAGGAVFLANGFAAGYLNSQVGQPYLLAPLLLAAFVADGRRRTPISFAVGSLATAVCIYAAFAPVVLLVVLTSFALALVLDEEVTAQLLVRRGLILITGTMLAAPLLVPAIDYIFTTDAGAILTSRGEAPRSLAGLLGLFTPAHVWHTLDELTYPEGMTLGWTAWIGISTAVVITASRWRGTWRTWLPKVIVVIAAVIHAQILPDWFRANLLFSTIRPLYWSSAMGLAAAFVVGSTLDEVAVSGRLRRTVTVLVALVVGGVLVGRAAGGPSDPWAIVFGLLIMVAVASAIAAEGGIRQKATLLASVLVIELLVHVPHQLPPRVDVVRERQPVAQWLREQGPTARFVNTDRRRLHPDWASPFGLHQLGTLSFPQPAWFRDFYMSTMGGDPDRLFLDTPESPDGEATGTGLHGPGLDAAAVRYTVVSIGHELGGPIAGWPIVFEDPTMGMAVRENEDAFPRVYLAGDVQPHDFSEEDRPHYTRNVALTDDEVFLRDARAVAGGRVDGSASLTSAGDEHLEVAVRTDRAAVLVVADTWYPYWKAEVDGEQVPVGRVNRAFRGVIVPEGRSRVVFTYVDRPFQIGLLLALLAGVALVGSTVHRGMIRRQTGGGSA